jgi:hypothetical protein
MLTQHRREKPVRVKTEPKKLIQMKFERRESVGFKVV